MHEDLGLSDERNIYSENYVVKSPSCPCEHGINQNAKFYQEIPTREEMDLGNLREYPF